MASIGPADEYIVSIEDSTSLLRPDDPGIPRASQVGDLPWSSIDWQRVEGDSSSAKVVIGNDPQGRTGCPFPLYAWDHAVAIRRNGLLVWWGPVVGWRYNQEDQSVEIAAKDILEMTKHVFVASDSTHTNAYSGVILSALVNGFPSGSSAIWLNMDPAVVDPTNYNTVLPLLSRTYAATQLTEGFEAVSDICSEIDGVMTTVADIGYLGYRYADPLSLAASADLSESTVLNRPNIAVDATNCATSVFAINGAFGGTGVAYVDDVLAYMANYTTAVPGYLSAYSSVWLHSRVSGDGRDLDATALAKGFAEATAALAPHVTIEQLLLSPDFGGTDRPDSTYGITDINSLVCGRTVADWRFADECLTGIPVATPFSDWVTNIGKFFYSSTIKHVRLAQLDVHVSRDGDGITEEIKSSWVPIALAGDT